MKYTLVCIFFILFARCSYDIPKPLGHKRIDKPQYTYQEYKLPGVSFNYASIARIDSLLPANKHEFWFNMVYPNYDAVVYCTYIQINKAIFPKVIEDSYHLAYGHSLMANDIKLKEYSNPVDNVGGVIYEIEGTVATPLQFYVTDSVAHFFRGSLYFNQKIDSDSVKPIIEFIETDIEELLRTIRFGKK